jgi:hypothetical protein
MNKTMLVAISALLIAVMLAGTVSAIGIVVVNRPTRENVLALMWAKKHFGARDISVTPTAMAEALGEEPNVAEEAVVPVNETVAAPEVNATVVETNETTAVVGDEKVLPTSAALLDKEVPVSSTSSRFNNQPWQSSQLHENVNQQTGVWQSRYIFVKRGVSHETVKTTYEQNQKPVYASYSNPRMTKFVAGAYETRQH